MDKEISHKQWKLAQEWEKAFWDGRESGARRIGNLAFLKSWVKSIIRDGPGDDRNWWWAKQFDDYGFVPQTLSNVLEFGCGPFTNLRIILRGRNAKHVFASDPLARHYVGYRGFQLSNKWKTREYLIDDHPMEEAPFADNYFDLAACINVLDHVRDVDLCMRQLIRVVAPGGMAVFGQDLTNEEDVKATAAEREAAKADVGHPHKFDNPEELLAYFSDFDALLQKVLSRGEALDPKWHFGTLIYVGKKRVVQAGS